MNIHSSTMDLQTSFLFCMTVFSVIIEPTVGDPFSCYACSYTLTGDPSLDYECADKPWNFTRGQRVVSCDTPKHCVTKTVYEKGYKRIRSIARYCGEPEAFQCGSNCCQGSTYYDTCQYQCQSDLCNQGNEAKRIPIDQPKPDGNTNMPTGNQVSGRDTFSCYSCAYQITGDPSVNYECVNSPWNFTIGQPVMPCDSSRQCVTKTVYEKGYTKVRSIIRHCGTPETFSCGSNCCQGSLYDDTCQFHCQDNLCNRVNEEKRIATAKSERNGKDTGNSACSGSYSVFLSVLSIIIFSLNLLR